MQTLWNSRDTLPAYPPLREDLHADAAVVGGGMAGILTAYALHTRGLRVVLLEGSRLASGVTAHTTAKITAQHGLFCERLVHDFGFHLAQQYLRANLCAVRQFRALVQQKRIDCGFSDESSFVYAAPDGPSLTCELEYALSLGAPASLVKPEGLPLPVRAYDLVETVGMLLESQERLRRKRKKPGVAKGRDSAQKKEIDRAKAVLMERNHMSEGEAHRYLQKTSMESGTNMAETAQMILRMMDG